MPETPEEAEPGISVLKPLRGLDPDAVANFASFCRQDYGRWEILFGAEDETSPDSKLFARSSAHIPMWPFESSSATARRAPIQKFARWHSLARQAKFPLLLVSDSDICAGRTHLRRMIEPLRDPSVGVVTCFYRTQALGLIGKLDALSLSMEFLPGALVARKLEGMSFAMGAGILIRREVLDGIGGFAALENGLADDYLLGKLPAQKGHRVEVAHDVVDIVSPLEVSRI